MKEPHIQGPASHDNPESCAGIREGAGEALTGAHAGRVLSRENRSNQGADAVVLSGRQYTGVRQGEHARDPARSKTSDMRGNSMRENREIHGPPAADGPAGRAGKVDDRNPAMHGPGKSHSPIVPTKSPNKAKGLAAEAVEGRGLTEENTGQQNTPRTQRRTLSVPSALDRVRTVAMQNKEERFSALLHHVTVDRLRNAFLATNKNATPGVDGVTWEHYQADLESNLENLHGRVQRGAYRAKPSRRAYIPKPDGRQRPLGIAALEDKILQRAVAEVLNAIYEADFLGFSHGFRPGRQAHVALDTLAVGINFKKISWILDADVSRYFDRVNHDWMLRFLEHRIADRRMLALIRKWLKAGVLEGGKWAASEEGTPQGSSISPLLANAYLHYVFDLWAHQWRGRHAKGDVIIVRWADDFVVGFQYWDDATRFTEALRERFQQYSLELHPDKTRLIRFGRFAHRDCRRFDGRKKPETFNFLGLTHACGKNQNGKFRVFRTTMRKRLTAKLHEVKAELRKRMHHPVTEQGKWLQSVVRGYFAYHAVPGNWEALGAFRTQCTRLWYRTLRRRSHKSRLTWERMTDIANAWLPRPRILHPWPEERCAAIIRSKSRVR
jgi:RNA-directed DNA polymerase